MNPLVLALLSAAMLGSATEPAVNADQQMTACVAHYTWVKNLRNSGVVSESELADIKNTCAEKIKNGSIFSADGEEVLHNHIVRIGQNLLSGTPSPGPLPGKSATGKRQPGSASTPIAPRMVLLDLPKVPVATAAPISQPAPASKSIFPDIDWDKAKQLAHAALEGARSFLGRCLHFVNAALDKILPAGWRGYFGPLGSAYQFASALNHDPKLLDKIKMTKLDFETLPDEVLPIGSVIVYDPGMCGLSPEHGHIEVVVSQKPLRACSDGCMDITKRLGCIKNSPKGKINIYMPVRSPAA